MPEKLMAVCSDKIHYCIKEKSPEDNRGFFFFNNGLNFSVMKHFVTVYLNLLRYRQTQPEYAV